MGILGTDVSLVITDEYTDFAKNKTNKIRDRFLKSLKGTHIINIEGQNITDCFTIETITQDYGRSRSTFVLLNEDLAYPIEVIIIEGVVIRMDRVITLKKGWRTGFRHGSWQKHCFK